MTDDTYFSDRELDLMSVLWKRGSGTVAEVRAAIADDLAYTTVLKTLQVLEEKGHIRHEEEGRAYRYYPVVESTDAGRSALSKIVSKIFDGSAELTLARLVEDRPISPEELERMKAILEKVPSRSGRGGRKR